MWFKSRRNKMKHERIADLAKIFLALSDKTRLRLIDLMRNGEVSVGFLSDSLGESQPKTSRHLAYLRNAGIVSTRREGKWVFYAMEKPADAALENILLATLRSLTISTGGSGSEIEDRNREQVFDNYLTQTKDILAETYMYEPENEEFPVYLL